MQWSGLRLCVDIIIEKRADPARPIILIERHYPPFGQALPGGFVDVGESLEQAACREALEETGLVVRLRQLLYVYSDPARDPRGHSVSAVFIGDAEGEPVAADDAKSARWLSPAQWPSKLAFDHAQMLADYRAYCEYGRHPCLC